ncbi:MAG: DNA polymerase III subunit delta' [Acidobacteria bacterium]|nr:DNA polymerase III subunit delta' [Acidobacteriota bacterium]
MTEEFIGNRPIRLLLHQSILAGTLAQAYIFSGPDGLGKKRLALNLARSLNCRAGSPGLYFCGQCSSCRKINTGNHPDVQVILPETKVFKIDQIRQLIQDIQFLPSEGNRRLFILEGAERMNEEAANSLLKTLEEPPTKSILVLLTTNFYALLPTIRSRCQIMKFMPIPTTELEDALVRYHDFTPGDAAKVARLAHGSLGAALELNLETVQELEDESFKLLRTMTLADDADFLEHLSRVAAHWKAETEQADLFANILISILREFIIMEVFKDRDHIVHFGRLETLRELRRSFQDDIVDELLIDLEGFYRRLKYNINAELGLQNLFLKHRSRILRRERYDSARRYQD